MANHIDFIEKIYDNIKSPLGFLCNKINYLTQNDNNNSCPMCRKVFPKRDNPDNPDNPDKPDNPVQEQINHII